MSEQDKNPIFIEFDLKQLEEAELTPNEYTQLWLIYKKIPIFYLDEEALKLLEIRDWLKIGDDYEVRSKFYRLIGVRETTTKVEDWIDEWIDLWPSGVKSGGSKPVRGDKKSTLKKMKEFVNEYKGFTKDQIIEATKYYLEERRRQNWSYIMICYYFIKKDGISTLASWIENLDKRAEEFNYYQQI